MVITKGNALLMDLLQMTLLESIPGCAAMIIKNHSREIIAANKTAREMGAVSGQMCFTACFLRNEVCNFCQAARLWECGEPQYCEADYQGRLYEGRWSAFSEDLYVHYLIDVTERKCVEITAIENVMLHRNIIRKMVQPFALHEIICDDSGNPVNYRFLDVNHAFGELLGKGADEIINKTVLELFPETESFWIDTFGKVALTGKPVHFENFSIERNRYFDVIAYSPKQGQFAVIANDITSHKDSEEALISQQSLLARSQELGHIGTWELNIPENILIWTDENYRIFGVPPESDANYELFLSKVHPEDRDLVEREWAAAMQGNPYDIVHRLLVDGEVRWVRQKADLIFDDQANVVRAIGFTQEVTERVETEEKLRQSEERYRALYENAPLPYHSLDENGCFLDVNPAWLSSLGYEREDVIGKFYTDFLHPDWQPLFEKKFPKLKQRGHVHDVHFKIRHKDGHYLDIALEGCIGSNLDGSFKQTYCVFQDITRFRQSEEELRKSESRFRLLVETSPDAVFVRDKHCFMYLNAAAVRLFGAVSEKDLIGTPIIERYHPEDRSKILQRMQMIEDNEKPLPLTQSVCLQLDGTEVNVESAVVPILFRGEKGALVFMRNITERVEQLKRQKSLEEQLHQSQKIESVGRLAGGVAHDFNNMLSVIIGHTEIAKRKLQSTASAQKDLEQILQAANRSRDITHQLLAFARKQVVKPRPLALNESVEGMLKMLHKLLGENIEIRWHPKGNLWPVKIDPSQLDQILANLCVNARDAIADTGRLTIETNMVALDQDVCDQYPGLSPGDYVVLKVIDDGRGMDEATLKKIFEPFFTTKEVGVGTGLGLATVYGIVKQSHGYIDVSSEPGKGTTFKIYLPRYEGPLVEAQVEKVKEVHKGRGETVLLVEDEKAVIEMATTMLEDLGYKVLAANTPTEALSFAETYHEEIHLLLTDVVMPEMNGRELTERLKTFHPELKCLYMSGYTADIIAHHGILDDGIHFVQKPFTMTDFSAAIRAMLD